MKVSVWEKPTVRRSLRGKSGVEETVGSFPRVHGHTAGLGRGLGPQAPTARSCLDGVHRETMSHGILRLSQSAYDEDVSAQTPEARSEHPNQLPVKGLQLFGKHLLLRPD